MFFAGYGVVGLTRGERVRRRLRALRNCLNVALGRLAKALGLGFVGLGFRGWGLG